MEELSQRASALLIGVPSYPVKKESAYSTLKTRWDNVKQELEEKDQVSLENMSAEELINLISNEYDPFPEGQFSENKATLDNPKGIARPAIESLAAQHNSKILYGLTTGNPRVVIGIDDEDHTPTGLECELVKLHNFSLDKYEHILIRNVARTYTRSGIFERNMEVKFFEYQNHLLLELSLKDFDELVLVNPKSWTLPIRVGASIRRLQGYEMIKELYK